MEAPVSMGAPVSPESKRSEFLKDVEALVNNDRAKQYGDAEENFDRIAELWGVYTGKAITRQDVAAMMILHKLSRLKNDIHHRDSWLDIAGYACLGGTI